MVKRTTISTYRGSSVIQIPFFMQTRIPDIKPGIEFLKYHQIVGGLIGITVTLSLVKSVGSLPGFTQLIVVFAIGLYLYSIYCGLLLFRKIKKGLAYSRVNQILQTLSFSILGYSFQYISGLFLNIGLDLTESFALKFNFGLSSWQFEINNGGSELAVNFNVVAIFLIILIEKLLNSIRLKENSEIVSALGEPVKEGE